ncbi:MAG: glycosyltransferase family 2 protein [Proteobacteria bacterium]|nr:glycosyltransferase family 2 protein [Pseudomonadota bacterium]
MISPLISVVLPVYNGEATLVCAMKSVFAQTFQDYELLLLDDGSTDDSLQVASMFSDPRLRVLSDGTNRGLAYRLNQGIDLARGRYFARMDQDDICFPERLTRQFEFLERNPGVDLLGCRALVFRNYHDILGLIPFRGTHEEICAYPWRGLYLAHPSWMGRTEWFRRYRYRIPEAILADDQELLLRAYPESRFACLEEVLLAYRKEHFRLSKIWRARLALLKVQLSHFSRRRQWSYAALSIMVTLFKVVIDCATSLLGCRELFFKRAVIESVTTSVMERFHSLMRDYELQDKK